MGLIRHPASLHTLGKRMESSTMAGVIVVSIIVGLVVLAFAGYLLLKYVPGIRSRVFGLVPARNAARRGSGSRQDMQSRSRSPLRFLRSARGMDISSHDLPGTQNSRNNAANRLSVNNANRRTSVRSVISLPPYSEDVRPTEQVLGREGERAGVDTIVDFPETIEEEESRREDEMESLYQIRLTRRQERSEREERRQRRRQARSRGDIAELARLRSENRQRNNNRDGAQPDSNAMLQDHQNRDRGRKISSVSYSNLGVARHDGSRVRANSNDSDRPLLDSASSIGGNRSQPRLPIGAHLRNQSTTSLRPYTPDYSEDDADSENEFTLTPWESSGRPSTSVSQGGDLGELRVPTNEELPEPPRYEASVFSASTTNLGQISEEQDGDAPPYESPVATGAPRLPAFAPLPSIQVSAEEAPETRPDEA